MVVLQFFNMTDSNDFNLATNYNNISSNVTQIAEFLIIKLL